MNREKPNYYSMIPADVRYDQRLTPNAKLLYAEITALTNVNGTCWASDNYFMRLYEVERRTIQNWLKQLEDNNYIKREVRYKEGTKEIEKRFITLLNINAQVYGINIHKGMENIFTDNTTSTNTTSINNNTLVEQIPFKEIIDYLNESANRQYRNVEANKKLIRARFNEGYTLEDFKTVIDKKVNEWTNTKWEKYLQPSTLFGTKFDQYLNQKGVKDETNDSGYAGLIETVID